MKELYNPELKERFITNTVLTKGSQNSYEYVFSKTAKWENRLDKDLCRFTHSELDILFASLQAKSQSSIQYQHNIIENYITYAIQNGFGDKNQETNFATAFTSDMLTNYVDKIYAKKKILSKEDFEGIVGLCENMQDASPIILIYHAGISGDLEELRNLKGDDIKRKEGFIIVTRGNGNQRKIHMEDKYLEILQDAYDETEYKKNNGAENPNAYSHAFKLEDSEYVLRNVKRRDNVEKISQQAIRQRVKKISSWYDNDFITPTSIMISGMIEYTKEYMKKHNKELDQLESSDYKKIISQFGIKENNWHTNKKRMLQHLKD